MTVLRGIREPGGEGCWFKVKHQMPLIKLTNVWSGAHVKISFMDVINRVLPVSDIGKMFDFKLGTFGCKLLATGSSNHLIALRRNTSLITYPK